MRNVPFEPTTTLSRKILRYAAGKGHSDARIAEMMGVPERFVHLVERRERSITLDHVELLAGGLGEPIGAMLAAATRPKRELTGEQKAFYESSEAFLLQGDRARAAMLGTPVKPAGKSLGPRREKGSAKSSAKGRKPNKDRGRRAA